MSKQKLIALSDHWSFIGILVFVAYIPQSIANLQGEKAQPFNHIHSSFLFNLGNLWLDKRT